jgi:hypothetical protein
VSSNVERMLREVAAAVEQEIPERAPGYRQALTDAVMDLIAHTAEHGERAKNINVIFDDRLKEVGGLMARGQADDHL